MSSKDAKKDYTYYTKGIWIEKKQRAYQAWLSYVLSPNSNAASSLNSKRLFAKVRGCVAKVYHKDPSVNAAMLKVEASISNGRLRLLTDGGFLCNPRMRKKAVRVLLGYDPFWLKLGLETVFRMTISPKQKGTSNLIGEVEEDELEVKSQLTAFIEDQFFSSGNLQKKLKKNVKRRNAVMGELAAVVLKRFLLLVLLLDKTLTTAELPESLPLLFDPSAKIKTSADMIRTFLKGSLFGEGDTVKQLEYMGYVLRYAQGVVNEFDYSTSNLMVDFRDGIRSCKLAEILLGTPVLKHTNFNTTSNAVKVYNVKLALSTFSDNDKNVGLIEGNPIVPQDIVDGNGETTVSYLWNVALLFQIPKLITISALVFEILQVKIHSRSHLSVAENSKICFPPGYDRRLALLLTWVQTVVSQYGAAVKNYRSSFADGSVLCYLVCHYLPAYLQPDSVYIAQTDNIKEEISRQSECFSEIEEDEIDSEDEDMDLKQFGVYSGKGWMDKATFKKHRIGILQNFDTVFSVMRSLGGIPETISAMDFEEQGPDETAVILYVSYMCARLLQVSQEERAALTIQRMWKIYKGYADPIELIQLQAQRKEKQKKKPREYQRSRDSRLTAYEYHRQQYSLSRASSSSGTLFSGFDSTYIYMDPKDVESVVKLQAIARGTLARRHFQKMKESVKVLEDYHPFIRDRCQYLRKVKTARKAATVIQKHYLRHFHRHDFQKKRAAAVMIQKYWRRYMKQKRYQEMRDAVEAIKARLQAMKEREEAAKANKAAIRIQASWRMILCHRHFQKMKSAAATIQSHVRQYLKQKKMKKLNAAAVVIQSVYRMHMHKRAFQKSMAAVLCLQTGIRMWLCRKEFQKVQRSVIKIQATYQMHVARQSFLKLKQAAICIQAAYRMHTASHRFQSMKAAALLIQSVYRMHVQRRTYQATLAAAVQIQTQIRMWLCRKTFLETVDAAVKIQAAYRMHVAYDEFHSMKEAAVVVQSHWKAYKTRNQFLKERSAAICIESVVRMHLCRKSFRTQKAAAIKIQRFYHARLQTTAFKQNRAAITIQSAWRSYLQSQRYQQLVQSVVVIQRAVRLHQKQKWLNDVESRLSTILVDFVSVMERTHEVVKAAIILQAYVRGYLVRKHCGQSPSEIKQQAQKKLAVKKVVMGFRGYQIRKKLAKRERACSVLRSWLPTIKERCDFLNKRRAAIVIQQAWRDYQERREVAAFVIQRAFRATKEKRRLRRLEAAAAKIQSAWRGHAVRVKAPRSVRKAVSKLREAERKAQADPTKTLQYKCNQAVQTVKNNSNSNVEQTFLALASLEMGTMYSARCCMDLIKSDALIPLLRVMAKCNRSADHQAAFMRGVGILKHLCRYKGLTMKVFNATECLDTLSERLQYYRDCPAIFTEIIAVFKSLLMVPRHREELANNGHVIKQLNSLWSLLSRKVDTERKYIIKLEADKASDKSAKRATEKAFVASNQLVELGDLFAELAVEPADFAKYAHQRMSPPDLKAAKKKKKSKDDGDPANEDWRFEATQWKPKNMLAKEKLSQLRTGGLSRESSAGAVAKPTYVNPKLQRRLKVLSTDLDAEALERRTNIRLMSDYRRKPKNRSDSVQPTETAEERTGEATRKTTSKRSASVVPDSKIPRMARSAMRRQGRL